VVGRVGGGSEGGERAEGGNLGEGRGRGEGARRDGERGGIEAREAR